MILSVKLQLFPKQFHHRFRIARTGGDIFRCYFVDPFEIVRIQEHIERVHIFAQIFSPFRSRNWDDVFALRQDPGQGELRGRATFFPSDLAHLANEIQIALKIFSLKPRGSPPVVVLRQVFKAFDLAGQESATERGIGDKTDAELAANTEHFLFWIARPERIFRLQRGNGMHRMRASDGIGASFGQTEIAHLAGPNQLRQRAYGFFDRRLRIDPMLIVKIDAINAEPAQARFACLLHVLGFAVNAAKTWRIRVAQDSELRRDDNSMAFAANSASEQLLIGVRTINVGGIKESNPKVDCAIDSGERFRIVAIAIKFRHAHTAESDRGNNRAAASKFSLFHDCPIQVLGAITSQRSRMALYSFWGSGLDSSRRAFSWQRSGFVVPTIAECTPGTLKTKRNAMAIDSSSLRK